MNWETCRSQGFLKEIKHLNLLRLGHNDVDLDGHPVKDQLIPKLTRNYTVADRSDSDVWELAHGDLQDPTVPFSGFEESVDIMLVAWNQQ